MADDSLHEEWRPVEGWLNYEISNRGRVRRSPSAPRTPGTHPGRLLKPWPHFKDRYPVVGLWGSGKQQFIPVHRLVAVAFLGPPPTPNHQVAHWDGDRGHCHVSNLRWATIPENTEDRMRHGTTARGTKSPWSILDESDVRMVRRLHQEGATQISLAIRLKVSKSLIGAIVRREAWRWLDSK